MPLSKLENLLSFESEDVPHSGFIRKDFSQSAPLSPKIHVDLGERDEFALSKLTFP